MCGEDITVQALAKVLDHVVALWLAVNVDVKLKLILDRNVVADLLLDELVVFLLGDLSLGEFASLDTNLLCLRERSYRSRGELWEVEILLLLSVARRELRLAVMHLLGNSLLPLLDLRVVGTLRRRTCPACSWHWPQSRCELMLDRH